MALNILKQENWNNVNVYRKKKIIWHNNSVYIALQDNSNSDPTDNTEDWMKLGDFIESGNSSSFSSIVDTEQNYIVNDPILKEGELAFTKDSDKYGWYKLGDGTSSWTQLDYVTIDGVAISSDEIDALFSDIDDGYTSLNPGTGTGSSGGSSFANIYPITDSQIWDLFAGSNLIDVYNSDLSDDEIIELLLRKKISWKDGNTADVAAVLRASQEGKIDLYNDLGWRIGDKRMIYLTDLDSIYVGEKHVLQPIILVLSHRGGVQLVNPVKNKDGSVRTEPAFQVDFENCFTEKGKMNLSATNVGGWKDCKRRQWCNSELKNKMQDITGEIFEEFIVKSNDVSNSSNIIETNDYFALRSMVELYGYDKLSASNKNHLANEYLYASQIDYYKNENNRKKYSGRSNAQLAYYSRSISKTTLVKTQFWANNYNSPSVQNANKDLGIAPFGCIG